MNESRFRGQIERDSLSPSDESGQEGRVHPSCTTRILNSDKYQGRYRMCGICGNQLMHGCRHGTQVHARMHSQDHSRLLSEGISEAQHSSLFFHRLMADHSRLCFRPCYTLCVVSLLQMLVSRLERSTGRAMFTYTPTTEQS